MVVSQKSRKFIEFIFSVQEKDAGEYDETQTTIGYIDVNSIESFYEDEDGGVYICTEGDEMKVMNDLEYVLSVVNE